jgi:hypothetical protein
VTIGRYGPIRNESERPILQTNQHLNELEQTQPHGRKRISSSVRRKSCVTRGAPMSQELLLCTAGRARGSASLTSKPLGEVAQALLLLSLKSKAEGPACYSSTEDLLATERQIEQAAGPCTWGR